MICWLRFSVLWKFTLSTQLLVDNHMTSNSCSSSKLNSVTPKPYLNDWRASKPTETCGFRKTTTPWHVGCIVLLHGASMTKPIVRLCHLSIYRSIYLPIYLSIYQSVYLPIYRSIYWSMYQSIYWSIYRSIDPWIHLCAYRYKQKQYIECRFMMSNIINQNVCLAWKIRLLRLSM